MEIDKATIDKIAELAKLEFNGKEKEEILQDINKVLSFIEKLNELDTQHVTPLKYVNEEKNKLREDEVKESMPKEAALSNAPEKDSDYIKVPKVIQKPIE